MEDLLGSSLGVFIGLNVILFGIASWMTGRALAETWKSLWLTLPYSLLLGFGSRFLTYALFEGVFLSVRGYVISTAVLWFIMFVAYRLNRARLMIQQYPWMYERRWLFAWRAKALPPTPVGGPGTA